MDLSAFNSKFRFFLIEELEGIYSSEKLESLSVVFEDLVKIPGFKFTIYQEFLVGAKKISLLISMK
jgi:hypothetical protein